MCAKPWATTATSHATPHYIACGSGLSSVWYLLCCLWHLLYCVWHLLCQVWYLLCQYLLSSLRHLLCHVLLATSSCQLMCCTTKLAHMMHWTLVSICLTLLGSLWVQGAYPWDPWHCVTWVKGLTIGDMKLVKDNWFYWWPRTLEQFIFQIVKYLATFLNLIFCSFLWWSLYWLYYGVWCFFFKGIYCHQNFIFKKSILSFQPCKWSFFDFLFVLFVMLQPR